MKKTYDALCPHCGLQIEIKERFPLRFYIDNSICPHCQSFLRVKGNQICNCLNLLIAIIFFAVFENKWICLGILMIVYMYIGCSHKLKQKLIHYGYFKVHVGKE